MHPAEQDSLARAHSPWARGLIAMAVAGILIALGVAFSTLRHPGTIEHALGLSTERTATVTRVDEVTICSRNHGDVYTLEWQDGRHHRSERIERCGDPWTVGDEVEIWSTTGDPQTSSPTPLRIAGAALVVGFTAAVVLLLRGWYRVRRAAGSALDGTWRPLRVRTWGVPGRGLRAEPPVRLRDRDRWWARVIHSDPGHDRSPGLPGILYVDAVRRGRPRGLSLHVTADGGRVWRWHG